MLTFKEPLDECPICHGVLEFNDTDDDTGDFYRAFYKCKGCGATIVEQWEMTKVDVYEKGEW